MDAAGGCGAAPRPRYRPLRPADPTAAAADAAAARRRRSEIIERVSQKLHAAFWVVLAALLVRFTDMGSAVFGADSKAVTCVASAQSTARTTA